MSREIKRYRVGDEIEIAGPVKVEKVGMHRQGDEDPVPTVTLSFEVDEDPPAEEEEPAPTDGDDTAVRQSTKVGWPKSWRSKGSATRHSIPQADWAR